MQKKIWIGTWIMSFSLVLSACSTNETTHPATKHVTSSGDVRETTSSVDKLPSFLHKHDENMTLLYQQAAQHQTLLEHIPCYCGCGESAGHQNNYDCFVYENKQDGSIVWDDHATKCGVCLEIAATSIREYKNGKSMKEIRQMIDETYKEGYAKPTPTKPL
ncbi:uncharacterized protein with PCYCGC motif [Thermolongibacillus altinsuensis]|uniref:Uncharacterized protein with PCYCGC motif n=1 Tax=Thermolongibacillus altinsuensis TaxID=575256 RepID=A0A4R1QKS9_9BACL|nr:PCYCGC motif-containing (lipo)protein [Thermolongibacillus altinsuensis]TCL53301.1 uncharacterized protein with PCYCGC motif [Thermolongibacillus altinsuensis]GMB07988.1 hypothetical protein B1no1_06980 [Thermolongibacillus altinsuensis]